MAKPLDATRVLRSVVSPALGLSLSVLSAACGNTGASTPGITSEAPVTGGATTAAAAEPATTSSAAVTTVAAAEPTATATAVASGAPTAAPTTTSRVAGGGTGTATRPVHPPGVTVYPRPGPPPHKVGTMVAPGFAPSSPALASSTEVAERPTRKARRATDPDHRLLRGRSRSLV